MPQRTFMLWIIYGYSLIYSESKEDKYSEETSPHVFTLSFYFFLSFFLSVLAVKLPGRESRAKESFFENMQQIVDEVISVLLPLLKEKPFALFGHRYGENKWSLNKNKAVVINRTLHGFNPCNIKKKFESVSVSVPSQASLLQTRWRKFTTWSQFTSFCLVLLHLM